MTPERLKVTLGTRSYPVWVGTGLLARADLWLPLDTQHLYALTDHNVAAQHWQSLRAALPTPVAVFSDALPAGESSKTWASCQLAFSSLARVGAHRRTVVLALGGGVVGDVAGFVASCWMRGVRWVQVPTSLLAMVDAAIGGKTAIDLPEGKNLVGSFHQPSAVVCDLDTLRTLPQLEFACGLAEVIKYAAIGDAAFFAWLEGNMDSLLRRDPAALHYAVAQSCRHKAGIVARDERETGERALLNFGHTFGHAMEHLSHYALRHGHAVAIGMLLAARLSERLGMSDPASTARLEQLLVRSQLPIHVPDGIAPLACVEQMRRDKKNQGNGLRLVLWHGIGHAALVDGVAEADALATLQRNGA